MNEMFEKRLCLLSTVYKQSIMVLVVIGEQWNNITAAGLLQHNQAVTSCVQPLMVRLYSVLVVVLNSLIINICGVA